MTDDRSNIVEALTGGDGSRLDAALERVFARPDAAIDGPLLLATVKGLARNGLAGLAARLLRAAANAELTALAEQIDTLPTGAVPRDVTESRYRRNREALLARRLHLAPLVSGFDAAGADLLVYESSEGNPQVIRTGPGATFRFVLPFADHRGRVAAAPPAASDEPAAFAILGVPSPALWTALVALRSPSGFVPPLEIVEPDAGVFAAWLRVVDAADVLSDDRIGVYVGPGARDACRDALAADDDRLPPTRCILNPRPGFRPEPLDNAWLAPALARRAARQAALKAKQWAACDARDDADLARRFAAAAGAEAGAEVGSRVETPPLRVVGVTTRHSTVIQHAMRDLARAFRRRGCRFDLLREATPYSREVDTWTALADGTCDLLLVINHLRFELRDRVHPGIPFVGWIQDHMDALWSPEAGAAVGPRDLVLAHMPWMFESFYGYPADQLLETTNVTDPETYHEGPVPEPLRARFACDVSYVSHGSATPETLVDELAAASPELGACFRAFLARARTRLAERGSLHGVDVYELLLASERDGAPGLPAGHGGPLLHPHAMRVYDRLLRHETLAWAADWASTNGRTLRIFGRGWEAHPTLGRFAAGPVENGESLRAVYRSSTVNLQVNGYGCMHQRLLDGLACGAFMLARYNPTDFLRAPYARFAEVLAEAGVTSFDELDAARSDPRVTEATRALVDLGVPCVGAEGRPARERELAFLRDAGIVPAAMISEERMFDWFTGMRFVPRRQAGDLPGFRDVAFRTRDEMFALLDRFTPPEATDVRTAVSAPMRDSVLEHDTSDVLVERIIRRMTQRLAPDAAAAVM